MLLATEKMFNLILRIPLKKWYRNCVPTQGLSPASVYRVGRHQCQLFLLLTDWQQFGTSFYFLAKIQKIGQTIFVPSNVFLTLQLWQWQVRIASRTNSFQRTEPDELIQPRFRWMSQLSKLKRTITCTSDSIGEQTFYYHLQVRFTPTEQWILTFNKDRNASKRLIVESQCGCGLVGVLA